MINKQFSIIDTGAIESPEKYSVSLEISEYSLAIALFNSLSQKFISFESWLSNEKNIVGLFEKIADSQILKTKYNDVSICVLDGKAVYIPSELFVAEELATYLDYTISAEEKSIAAWDEIPNQNTICCYRVLESIANVYKHTFPNTKYSHFSAVFISKIIQNIKSENKSIVVFFHENTFEIASVHQQKIINYNSFSFQTVQEYLYFILLFLQQSDMDTETVNCFVGGGIEENSALMQGTLKYIRNVELFRCTEDKLFSDAFEAIPKNRYDILFQNALNK